MEGAARRRRVGVAAVDAALLREAAERAARGERFALATVVRRTAPSSARAGQKALVLSDGTLRGWLGGACIEPNLRKEALEALADGRPRLVIFAPDASARRSDAAARADTTVYPMTCHSGGTVEIYVEPQLPAPTLALLGDSPVNRALADMAPTAGYAVRVVGTEGGAGTYPGADWIERLEDAHGVGGPPTRDARSDPSGATGARAGGPSLFVVVASMGEWDEEAAERALRAGAAYVGVVSSPRRAEEIRRILRERGLGQDELDRLVSPAGLDVGAESPGEIAVSILAELVELRRRGTGEGGLARSRAGGDEEEAPDAAAGSAGAEVEAGRKPATAVDPVCGMHVEVKRVHHAYEHAGTTYYFCCPRCRERFSGDPDRFVAT